MALNHYLVDVRGLHRVHGREGKIVDDQQVEADQLAHLDVVAGVEAGGLEPLEQPVGPLEVHARAAANGDVSAGGCHERLAHADGAEDHDVVGVFHEAQRDELGPQRPVVGDGRGVVPGVEDHGGVEMGGAGA